MTSKAETFRHAAVYSLASFTGKAVGFIMLPLYAHLLGDKGYGIIGMLDAATNFLMSLYNFGITWSVIRFYHEEPDPERKKKVISTAVLLLWSACLIVLLLGAILGRPLSIFLLGDVKYWHLVIIALASFVFDLTGTTAGAVLLIEQRSALFTGINLGRLFVGLGLNIWLIVGLQLGVLGYFISSAGTALLSSAVFHAIALWKCGRSFDRGVARKIIGFELPMVPGNMVSFVSNQVERILLRFLTNLESVGVLEMGYKFPPLLNLFVSEPFMRSWHTKRTEIAEQPDAPQTIGSMFTYFLFLMVFAGLLLSVNIGALIQLLTPEEFWPAARISQVLIVAGILQESYYHLIFGLYYHKQTRVISMIKAVTAVIKIAISFLLISSFGMGGAAYSAAIIAAVQLVWVARRAQALYPLVIEYRKVTTILSTALVLGVGLNLFDLERTAFGAWFTHAVFNPGVDLLRGTFVERLASGKVFRILESQEGMLTSMLFKTLIACLYLGILPLIVDQLGVKVRTALHRFRRA